jgi:hypothetical protein
MERRIKLDGSEKRFGDLRREMGEHYGYLDTHKIDCLSRVVLP